MKCFVIMPFGSPEKDKDEFERFTNLYNQWLKPTVESIIHNGKNLECNRADADNLLSTGDIVGQIIENLYNSEIVIADLSNKNPNVFYELGVRHAIRNNTILISSNVKDTPFDVGVLRTIPYEYSPHGMLKFKATLEIMISNIVENMDRIDNPVQRYISDQEVRTKESRGIGDLSNDLETFRLKVNEVSTLMERISSDSKYMYNNPFDLRQLCGIWYDEDSDTKMYIQLINNVLFMPYSYNGDPNLTAHYYNCKIVDNTIYARFEWFKYPNSGVAIYEIVNNIEITGGWWMGDDVPGDISNIQKDKFSMVKVHWKKIGVLTNLPSSVTKYFESQKRRLLNDIVPKV